MFPPDNEAGLRLAGRQHYQAFMADRLKHAFEFNKKDPKDGVEFDAAKGAVLSTLGERVFTHGDLSPNNIKRLPDGRLGLFDFGMSFFGPGWAEPYAVLIAGEDEQYAKPLREAFKRVGMDIGADLQIELWGFRRWHFVLGGPFARWVVVFFVVHLGVWTDAYGIEPTGDSSASNNHTPRPVAGRICRLAPRNGAKYS
ncbi:hypothetical protein BJ138DRAFT_1106822 [Hygrophoropsis aurantiaca]|uniref:Uncharacterized protein n=1 Tax=Hygrophoropsis aurantiaca TaxID=72124 RepID=A0ACB7ZUT7_9AGAM|nr:hypothetical protein BJ138DRAFT_1106822 [Hygrophoropsis aurantiaca]